MHAFTSYLFVPANRPERFEKALSAGAGSVIIDLEDAVPPEEKVSAREQLKRWLTTAQSSVTVRINSTETPWFSGDLAVLASPRVGAILLPKADKSDDLMACAEAAPQARLMPLIETATGFDALKALAKVRGVERFVFGSIDFQLDMGISGECEELLFFRSQLVLASRLAKLAAPVDGVTTEIRDTAVVQSDAARARRLGFGAKLCIHPSQVAPVNAAFRPTGKEVDWAHRVVAASRAAGGAAAMVDGKMIDLPVTRRAQSILNIADAPT
ncbi:HpcH/HpaI aldolase/citrate lyase family protein [Ottowia thiooxydans]|uniref:Citrate lyase subunit beta/citryl-CoA lyase n=1 Tax=Ottowia thiooxydans TaxID=219182 RepID=A0ABV2Q9F8_9BURK